MLKLAYNISPVLNDSLRKIELLRQKILLVPLSPQNELKLRWEANLDRIYWSLALSNNPMTKFDMVKTVINKEKRRLNKEQSQVVRYKLALDYIYQNWLVSEEKITTKTVVTIHKIIEDGELNFDESSLNEFMEYIQLKTESPIIQAAITQVEIENSKPFSHGNARLSRLLALLILYKHGYDFRGLLTLEEYWRKDLATFQTIVSEAIKTKNLTMWLIYFTKAMITQLEKIAQDINYPRSNLDLPNDFWQLNDRQKQILTILEEPKSVITNKNVQSLFKVSQITASRDLAKLSSLGLLFSHGKGRSVKYTKV